jgi:membrane associated rhomboid family serine protease
MNGQAQISLPRLSLINKILIMTTSLLFVIDFIFNKTSGGSIAGLFGVSAQGILRGQVYTLITYPLIGHSFMEVILNSLMLWLMGSEFEENWGRARYLKFLATVFIGGAIFYLGLSFIFFRGQLLFSYPLTGMSGVVASLCVAYAVIYPTRVFSFLMVIPVQAKYFCWILVAIALFQGVQEPLMVGAWGQLGAIISGFLFMTIVSNKNFKELSGKMSQITQLSNRKKSKAKLSIVKDDEDKPPKYWQ